jgi:hypothetical protein
MAARLNARKTAMKILRMAAEFCHDLAQESRGLS